jgi:hypothetical protein
MPSDIQFFVSGSCRPPENFYTTSNIFKKNKEVLNMTNGIALTIGLNEVDPQHYAGWSGELVACEADAKDMANIAISKGFQVKTLLTKEATRASITEQILKAAKDLKSGDIFILSYSGHGGQLPDLNKDEADAQDETWCLYDGQLVDDELNFLYAKFSQGVRILVFSDSCHSGTVLKAANYSTRFNANVTNITSDGIRYRFVPRMASNSIYRQNKAFYDKILKDPALKVTDDSVKASALLISGCQDNQYSQDGEFNGLFTSQLLEVWKDGAFVGNYKRFWKNIVLRMPPDQTPNYYTSGIRDYKFELGKPFTI